MKDEPRDGIDADPFARFCRPKLAALLRSLKLDVTYERALGNYLFKRSGDDMDSLIPVLDLVGGFGAALLGHNPPELVSTLVSAVQSGVPFVAQGGSRKAAGELARKLNELAQSAGRYYCIFTNSGTEAVEAALTHPYQVRFAAGPRHCEATTRKLHAVVRPAGPGKAPYASPGGRDDR